MRRMHGAWRQVLAGLACSALVVSLALSLTWYRAVSTPVLPLRLSPDEPEEPAPTEGTQFDPDFNWPARPGVQGLFARRAHDARPKTDANRLSERSPPILRYVRRKLPPLRLEGFWASPEGLRGIFVVAATGESVIAAPGHRFADLGLVLESLVRRSGHSESGSGDVVIEWWIRDVLSGHISRHDSANQASEGTMLAGFEVEASAPVVEVEQGGALVLGADRWVVDSISEHPPEVRLTGSGALPELLLRPVLPTVPVHQDAGPAH